MMERCGHKWVAVTTTAMGESRTQQECVLKIGHKGPHRSMGGAVRMKKGK